MEHVPLLFYQLTANQPYFEAIPEPKKKTSITRSRCNETTFLRMLNRLEGDIGSAKIYLD